MAKQQIESAGFFNKHGWKILIGISIIFGLFGLGDLIQGMNADTAIAESILGIPWEEARESHPEAADLIDLQVRAGGAQLLLVSVLSIVVCLVGYRRGERWAWYTFWIFPAWMISIFMLFFTADRQPHMPAPPPMLSAPIFLAIAVLVLLLSYRKFFPKQS